MYKAGDTALVIPQLFINDIIAGVERVRHSGLQAGNPTAEISLQFGGFLIYFALYLCP